MIDSSLVAGLALLLGSLCPRALAPALFAASALILLTWARLSRFQLAVIVILVALGALRASLALERFGTSRDLARQALGAPDRCAGTAKVVSSPARLGDRALFLGDVIAMECATGQQLPAGTRLRLYAPDDDLARGDTIELVASLGTVETFRNHEVDSAFAYAARLGATLSGGVVDYQRLSRPWFSLASWIDLGRKHARTRIVTTYPADAAPMARALVLGENDLPADDADAFRISGLSHLLAVSGTHIILAVLGLVNLLHGLLKRIEAVAARMDCGRIASGIGIPLAWIYAEFAGSGGSVRRAALMASVALAARVLARKPDGQRAFGMSLLAGTLMDPLAAFDASFGLSALATAGLLVLSRPLQSFFSKLPRPLPWVSSPLSATLGATTFCIPWLALLGDSVSLVGLLANIVAVPIGEMVSLPACLVHLLLGWFPSAERGIALLGAGSLLAVRAVARWGASLSWLSLPVPRPTPWHLAVLAVTVAALLLKIPKQRTLTLLVSAALLIICEIATVQLSQPRGVLRISFLDVGQGDSILVDFPDGRLMLVDGGGIVGSPVDPGVRVVRPVLRARRRHSIDIGVLTHPHPDHVIGLASTIPHLGVGQFWDNGLGNRQARDGPYGILMRNLDERGVPVHGPPTLCGTRELAGVQLSVIGPCPRTDPGAGGNDNSIVMHLSFGKHSALLVGDAEHRQEKHLLALPSRYLKANILKIGHHGSATSSTDAFLDAVSPELAVITSGVRNRFGHPTPQTLERLSRRGVQVFRSDLHGGVVWETDGTRMTVEAVRP